MGKLRVELVRVSSVLVVATFFAMLIPGCWAVKPIDQDIDVPGHTVRTHAPVSMPAFTTDGEKLIINGNKLQRYSVENVLVHETLIPLSGDWSESDWSSSVWPQNNANPAVYNDALGNLYLDLGDELTGINADGEILWRSGVDINAGMLFPDAGGVLVINQISRDSYLTKFSPDGTEEWRRYVQIGPNLASSVAVNSNQIIIVQASQLIALGLDGTELWKVPVGDSPKGTPYMGNSGNLTVVCAYEKLHAFDETGVEVWSRQPPAGFETFRELLVLNPDRVVVSIANLIPARGGLLVLDGSGNQVNLVDDFYTRNITTADGSRFVSLENVASKRYVGLHSTDTGELLWQYRAPEAQYERAKGEGDVVDIYFGWAEPFDAPNGMTYFTINSTLFELDHAGKLVGSFPGTVTADEWVDAHIIPW